MRGKKGDFDFEWIFAIVAGAAILILAIYGASKIGSNIGFQTNTETGKQISILTDPLQAGFGTTKAGAITFKQEAKIVNECNSREFGSNDISVSLRSGVGKPWTDPGAATSIEDKYIFSDVLSGKVFRVFSKPFNFPFKVSDLIFMTTAGYCFIDVPEELDSELRSFNSPNIRLENCSVGDVKVCFGKSCNISIYGTCQNCESPYEQGYVEKNGARMNYVGNLMYAAVFASRVVYECNVKRLLYRAGRESEVLAQKVDLMNARDVGSNLGPDLLTFASMTSGAGTDQIVSLDSAARELKLKNDLEGSKLW